MQTFFLIWSFVFAQVAAPVGDALPIVEQSVDTIAFCHVLDGAELVFFFDFVQGHWSCLDHRWIASDMTPGRTGDSFTLTWHDEGSSCYRIICGRRWVETWTDENPMSVQHKRPWFARLACPGLAQPPERRR